MQKTSFDIIVFLIIVNGLIITMILFLVTIIFLNRKKQELYGKNIQDLKLQYEKTILDTRLEIQEQTFQHISREIHDNINLSLTLAKLNLNTLLDDPVQSDSKIKSSVDLLSKSINELSSISKALNSDLIIQQSLLESLRDEINRITLASRIEVNFKILGEPVFLNSQKELIIFRIIQEAFNNIIKHSMAESSTLLLNFTEDSLVVEITDNGKGFNTHLEFSKSKAGLKNMQNRVKFLGGNMKVESVEEKGTQLIFKIPYTNNDN